MTDPSTPETGMISGIVSLVCAMIVAGGGIYQVMQRREADQEKARADKAAQEARERKAKAAKDAEEREARMSAELKDIKGRQSLVEATVHEHDIDIATMKADGKHIKEALDEVKKGVSELLGRSRRITR